MIGIFTFYNLRLLREIENGRGVIRIKRQSIFIGKQSVPNSVIPFHPSCRILKFVDFISITAIMRSFV